MDIKISGKNLRDLSKVNVILGKNGCGKSTVLRMLDSNQQEWTHIKYISPERGGKPVYDPNVENNMNQNPGWLIQTRRQNQDESFRQKSIALLKDLETLVNRKRSNEIRDKLPFSPHFDEILSLVNNILDNVKLVTNEKSSPEFQDKLNSEKREPDVLSSGEKELITLAAEILHFVYQIKNGIQKPPHALLLFDEPDVHLHPDLQYKLIQLLLSETDVLDITIIISTHSTAILGSLFDRKDASVCFMKQGDDNLQFSLINQRMSEILPVFGAHPLSSVFVKIPLLLVEGEDDERIWQQAVRSSEKRLKFWPCQAYSKDNLSEYENTASQIIGAVYDDAKAYSLRDRDDDPYEIDNIPNVIRARLNCYAAENLLLSDDVLNKLGLNWDKMKEKIIGWLSLNLKHSRHDLMLRFSKDFNRRDFKIKDLVLIFLYLAESNKPWEVLVGQTIAQLNVSSNNNDGSLVDFLGSKICNALNLLAA